MSISIEEQFKANSIALAQNLCQAVEKIRKAGLKTVPQVISQMIPAAIRAVGPKALIEKFINGCHLKDETGNYTGVCCWDYMKKRDEEFFLANVDVIFADLPVGNVNMFVQVFTAVNDKDNFIIGKSTRDSFWDFLDIMIKQSIKYVHINRSPFSRKVGDKTVKSYRCAFLEFLDMGHNFRTWNLELDFPLEQ